MPYALSPEQKVVVEALVNSLGSDVKYFDLTTAFEGVNSAILSLINNNKKILIHTSTDEQATKSIIDLIKQCGLDSLTINIGNQTMIPESDIIVLRSVLKKGIDTSPIIDQILNNQKLEAKLKTASNYFCAMDRKVLSKRTFREFSSSIIYQQDKTEQFREEKIQINVINLDFTAQEYYGIKKSINKASELYLREYDLLDNLDLISDVVWSYSNERLEELRANLNQLITESKSIETGYKNEYANLSSEATKEMNNELDALQKSIELHQRECTSYHINSIYKVPKTESKFSIFNKKQQLNTNDVYIKSFDDISGIIKKLSSEWYDSLPAPTDSEISFDYIIQFINSIKEAAPQYQERLNHSLNNSIHRVNRINTDSEAVKSLDSQLTRFIEKIDELDFINQKFTSNTLSFIKQMELSKSISNVLGQCKNLIGLDSDYTKWKTFEKSNSPQCAEVISVLKKYPKGDWIKILDDWYNDQIRSAVLSTNTISSQEIKEINNLNKQINKNEISAIVNKIQLRRMKAAEDLKTQSKDVYSTLFKKKTLNPTSWREISTTCRSFLQDFFPIHIDSNLNNAEYYDVVISFSKRPEIMNEGSKVHHLSPILTEDLENKTKSKDLLLYLNSYKYTTPLAELPNTEKLKASKKLAKFILSLNQQVKIYQVKSGNILSLLPINDDAYFEREMERFGIKSIDTSGTLYDKLTESILFTNRQPYLLIKDELINPELHQHLIWQAGLLQTFQTAGYKILSLNTSDQLENNKLAFETIINSIVDVPIQEKENVDTPVSKPMDAKEFATDKEQNK